MTTFVDRVYQNGGMPVGADLVTNKIFCSTASGIQKKGRAWFVDTAYGGSGNGKTPSTAFSTMDEAFDSLASGDIIYFVGKVTEQLVTPVQIFDVTVVGCGNLPRHADSTPAGGNWAASQWSPPSTGTAAQATVRVLQQGWRFVNILFTAIDANAAMIEIVRNAGSGDDERDASHASILGCRFAGAGIAIRSGATSFTENPHGVKVEGNTFLSNSTALLVTAATAINWQILNNQFLTCTNDISGAFVASKIRGNGMSLAPTKCINLTGGSGNMVNGNYLAGTYADGTLYKAGTSDNWNGNYASTGVTAAVPA